MVRIRMAFSIGILFTLVLIMVLAQAVELVFASESTSRRKTIMVKYVEYEWWLVKASDNLIACQIYVEHDDLPTYNEVFSSCGNELYKEWTNTSVCSNSEKNKAGICGSLYLHPNGSRPKEREILVELPPVNMSLSLPACEYATYSNYCSRRPILLLTADEPLPNDQITYVHYTYGGYIHSCLGSVCEFPVPPTSDTGTQISFWASSSFGDESERFTAKIRAVEPERSGKDAWQVNIISSQWQGGAPACCSQTWNTFPPIDELPLWLTTVENLPTLASDEPYTYLAGRLISQGVADASECPWNGLLSNGWASPCGLEKARNAVDEWQNRFDDRIMLVSNLTGVPGQLLKNIIAQESQFWPGVFTERREYGLGQITYQGADTVLLWNPVFYKEFCPLVLAEETCEIPYPNLEPAYQELLQGALAVQANSQCSDCVYGIDLAHADFSINLLAQSLMANCQQVGQIVLNETYLEPSIVSNYEDLWHFTLANYNAGPGCLTEAIRAAYIPETPLTWDDVSRVLPWGCTGAVQYVENITGD